MYVRICMYTLFHPRVFFFLLFSFLCFSFFLFFFSLGIVNILRLRDLSLFCLLMCFFVFFSYPIFLGGGIPYPTLN